MIYTQSSRKSTIFPKNVNTASFDAGMAIKNAAGANAEHPFIAGVTISESLDFPNTSAQHSADLTVNVSGAQVNDTVIVGAPNIAADTSYSGFVSSAGVVTVRFNNYSSGSINPGAQTFTITVIPQP